MSHHKRFHSLRGKGKYANAYAARHRQNPYASALHPSQLKKKTAPSATNTESGKVEQNLNETVATSHDTREMEDTQV